MNKARVRGDHVVLKPGQRPVGEPAAAGKAACRMKPETNGKSTTAVIAPHADTSRRQVPRKVSSPHAFHCATIRSALALFLCTGPLPIHPSADVALGGV